MCAKKHILTIDKDLEKTCDSGLTREQIKNALFSIKRGKSPGIDGLSVEFYIHFWDIIQEPLFCMYCECVSRGEMITTMKQGVIPLIPKPDKDNILIENWRPITLLTIDYKFLASVYATRLKMGLLHIVATIRFH